MPRLQKVEKRGKQQYLLYLLSFADSGVKSVPLTTGWELTVGMGGPGRRRAKGENWENCNRITIKIVLKKALYKSVKN